MTVVEQKMKFNDRKYKIKLLLKKKKKVRILIICSYLKCSTKKRGANDRRLGKSEGYSRKRVKDLQ